MGGDSFYDLKSIRVRGPALPVNDVLSLAVGADCTRWPHLMIVLDIDVNLTLIFKPNLAYMEVTNFSSGGDNATQRIRVSHFFRTSANIKHTDRPADLGPADLRGTSDYGFAPAYRC